MAHVIVLEPTSLVLRETRTFGDLVYISDEKFQAYDITSIIQKTVNRLNELDYNPLVDSICLTGAAQSVAIFVGVIANCHSEFMVLIFDNKTNKYKQRMFKL